VHPSFGREKLGYFWKTEFLHRGFGRHGYRGRGKAKGENKKIKAKNQKKYETSEVLETSEVWSLAGTPFGCYKVGFRIQAGTPVGPSSMLR